MTQENNKRILFGGRIQRVTRSRLGILAEMYNKSPGEMIDYLVSTAYTQAMTTGRVENYLHELTTNGKEESTTV